MAEKVIIRKDKDQSYSLMILDKASWSDSYYTKERIKQNIDAKFYCIYDKGNAVLIDSAMLKGLVDSGVLLPHSNNYVFIEE